MAGGGSGPWGPGCHPEETQGRVSWGGQGQGQGGHAEALPLGAAPPGHTPAVLAPGTSVSSTSETPRPAIYRKHCS